MMSALELAEAGLSVLCSIKGGQGSLLGWWWNYFATIPVAVRALDYGTRYMVAAGVSRSDCLTERINRD